MILLSELISACLGRMLVLAGQESEYNTTPGPSLLTHFIFSLPVALFSDIYETVSDFFFFCL